MPIFIFESKLLLDILLDSPKKMKKIHKFIAWAQAERLLAKPLVILFPFALPSYKQEGIRQWEWIEKIMIKSHAFLLDPQMRDAVL